MSLNITMSKLRTKTPYVYLSVNQASLIGIQATTMTTLTSTTTHTLMQTALVTASGPTMRCQARILIDTGSQKRFITQCLKNTLQLKAARNEILDVTTGTPKSYEVVTLTLNHNYA